MQWLAVRAALVASLLLASAPSAAKPHGTSVAKPHGTHVATSSPSLRTRAIGTAMPAAARVAFDALARQGWRASWDRHTGVPARLWGSYIAVPGAIADAAIAERAARQFLAQHASLLAPGARPADFVLAANQLDDGIRTVGFTQTWRGLPVHGGQLGFVFAHDRLFAIGSSAWPHVTAAVHARARTILPVVRGTAIAYHAVDVTDVDDRDGLWRVYVGADGREVARESRVMSATGTLKYNAGIRHAGGARADFPVPAASILVDATAATTAANGTFSWTGNAAATVIVPSLAGTYVRVVNQAGAAASTTLTVQPGGAVTWDLASDELGDAQLSTYIYANLAKDHARLVNPGLAPWLDTQLDVFVNENGSCNAYTNGDEIHLFRKDATCENSGRVADVVFHELAHTVHNHSVIAGMGSFETHLSEGLADFFTADFTGDPAVGRGFFLSGSPLRDIDPVGAERVYPLDFDFDPHISGLIISGALWDLREALIDQLGTAAGLARTRDVLTGIMQRADDIGTTFIAALIADDDDGDLGNDTPSYCAIERAFGRHGLVPDYVTTRVTAPVVDGLDIAMTVDTPAGTKCAPPAVTSITVTWRAGDGVASSFDLVAEAGTWRGAFPAQPDGTVISYAVAVVYDDGGVQAFPNNPADPRYQLFVGTAVPIFCTSFDEDPQWPQTSNAGPEWQWGMPAPGASGNDPAAAFSGSNVLGTDVKGDGLYRPNLNVSTSTPLIDVRKYQRVHLQYWRWLTVEDGAYDQATMTAHGTVIWRNALSETGTLDHVDREWRFHHIDLTPYVDRHEENVQVSWHLATDFGKELGGWNLDDVCIVGQVKNAACGDGEIDLGETCDDGNAVNGDGCDDTCLEEIVAGGGGCCDAGSATPSYWLCVAVLVLVRRRRSSRS